MATSPASRSPGARLLRTSRLFSMPAPISAPPDLNLASRHKSPTSTTPFPTHQSVTTHHTSRMVGDWGFKRPMPLKTTTKSSTPLIRVRQVDSAEHVTDFSSSSDHAITLEKFRELHLPITIDRKDNWQVSAFEEQFDVTALSREQKEEMDNHRWRFSGPWLAGMPIGAFKRYVQQIVRPNRPAFRQYLRAQLAAERTEQASRWAVSRGLPPHTVRPEDITERELSEYTKDKRHDRVTLYRWVSHFLDLAPMSVSSEVAKLDNLAPNKEYAFKSDSPYSKSGPPITHPSAGISYLRTRAYLENHPIYGPQKEKGVYKARVVVPRNGGGNWSAKLGVAGVIAIPPQDDGEFNKKTFYRPWDGYKDSTKSLPRGYFDFDPEDVGGTKVHVIVTRAAVNARGNVVLSLKAPTITEELDAVMVQREMVGEYNLFDDAKKVQRQSRRIYLDRPATGGKMVSGSNKSYGLRVE